jgi:seryl-tRNA synthetase
MLDIRRIRQDPHSVAAALERRGVDVAEIDAIVRLDQEHRLAIGAQEELRKDIKALSREVGAAKREGNEARAQELTLLSKELGEKESVADDAMNEAASALHAALLYLPNVPALDAPDGRTEKTNVVVRTWWPQIDAGEPARKYAEHQRVPHFDIGIERGLLDLERGAKLSGSMFPLFRGRGARLLRALSAFALDAHTPEYEEIRPPTFVLTGTMMSTGHLPKFADDAYHIERDDLWGIPTAEVPLTSMYRDEILDEAQLPIKMTALTPCYRREAGSAGKDTRGLLRVHEFDKVELFAYATPQQADDLHADVLVRASALLEALGLTYRVLDLCAGDLGNSARRTFDLEAYAPGVDRWLEVSSVSWFGDYQARRANVRYRSADGGAPQFVHTVNGSALAWPRIWAALVETYRQVDGTIELPEVLAPYLGGDLTL